LGRCTGGPLVAVRIIGTLGVRELSWGRGTCCDVIGCFSARSKKPQPSIPPGHSQPSSPPGQGQGEGTCAIFRAKSAPRAASGVYHMDRLQPRFFLDRMSPTLEQLTSPAMRAAADGAKPQAAWHVGRRSIVDSSFIIHQSSFPNPVHDHRHALLLRPKSCHGCRRGDIWAGHFRRRDGLGVGSPAWRAAAAAALWIQQQPRVVRSTSTRWPGMEVVCAGFGAIMVCLRPRLTLVGGDPVAIRAFSGNRRQESLLQEPAALRIRRIAAVDHRWFDAGVGSGELVLLFVGWN